MFFLIIFDQKLARSRVLNAIIFCIDEQCNLIFETTLFTNCKIYIIIFIQWSSLSFLLCLSHFCFFPVSPFLCSLSLPLLNISTSKPMVDSQWPSKSQTHCPNHKPMVDLWLTPNQPPTIIATAQGEQTMAAHGEQRPHGHSRNLNQPTATHAIWSHPWQSTMILTHPRPPTAIWTPPTTSHDHHRPTVIWIPRQSKAFKPILRQRRSFHYERKRGESVMGLLAGLLVAAMVEVFFFFFLFFSTVVGGCGGYGCGCGGFFLLWFFFLFFLVVVICGRAKISLKGGGGRKIKMKY